MHYAEDSCLLARSFGSGVRFVHLRLERTEPSHTFNVALIGRAFRSRHPRPDLSLTFGPVGKPDPRDGVMAATSTVGEKLPMLLIEKASLYGRTTGAQPQPVDAALLGPAGEAKFTKLTIDRSIGEDFQLELGPMDQPMAALRACTDDLVKGWAWTRRCRIPFSGVLCLSKIRQHGFARKTTLAVLKRTVPSCDFAWWSTRQAMSPTAQFHRQRRVRNSSE